MGLCLPARVVELSKAGSFMVRSVLWVLALACAATCRGEVPEVSAFSPAGGRRGTEVTVKLQGKVDPAAVTLWTSRPGIELAAAEAKDTVRLKVAPDAPLGVHYLRFHNAEGASALRPFVVSDIAELLEVEPNDTLDKAVPLMELPVTVNGVLEKSGAVDMYSVKLQRGQTLVAALTARQTLGSPMDGLLQVVDERGFVLEQNDDHQGFDARVVCTVPREGTYFVRTFAFPAAPDTSIRFSGGANYIYRLLVASGPFVDRVFPLALAAEQPGTAQPGGWNLPDGAASLMVPPLTTGIHTIGHDGWVSTARVLATSYPIQIETEPGPSIAVPCAAAGRILRPGEVDSWKVAVAAGQKVRFTLTATHLGSPLDAVLRIADAEGTVIKEFDDAPLESADLQVGHSTSQATEWIVSVTDRFAHGGPDYAYVLEMTDEVPSVALTVTADAFVVKAEAMLEIPVTVERRSGFAASLPISLQGLPEGVTAETVVSEPKGDSAKALKLIVKSTRKEAWSGPVQIVGRPEGAGEVTAALIPAGSTDRLSHLWLTVRPTAP